MFSGLRKAGKKFTNATEAIDARKLYVGKFPSFDSVFDTAAATKTRNGNFITITTTKDNKYTTVFKLDKTLRNNDVNGIRQAFNATPSDVSAIDRLRLTANIPDAKLHQLDVKKQFVRNSHPDTIVKNYADIDAVVNRHPKLKSYLKGLGIATLAGAGVVLVLKGVDIIQDIVDALSRTGGSFFYSGIGDQVESCWLRYRSCGVPPDSVDSGLACEHFVDPIYSDIDDLVAICVGYNKEIEQSVCRRSDPYNEDVDSQQWVDISELAENQTLKCIEPYTLADVIADLGLDGLLGPDSVVSGISDSFSSVSQYLMYFIFAIFAILIIVIGFKIYQFVKK